MKQTFRIFPVGVIHKRKNRVEIEIYQEYADALLGLDTFSHILVLFWFHKNDTPAKRGVLRVHPRKNRNNPLTGVFGTHSPVRPNLIGATVCGIRSISANRIGIDDIDALDGSPVIDIKSYIPDRETKRDVRLPDWV